MSLQDLIMLNQKCEELEIEIEKRDAEIVKLKKVSDMKSAIVEGMRRVCAIARMVNNQRPDVRMTAAFESYDISKLNNSHRAEIEKLKADLKREQDLIDKFIVTTDNLLTHSNEDYEWQTEQLIKLARLTQQQRREG